MPFISPGKAVIQKYLYNRYLLASDTTVAFFLPRVKMKTVKLKILCLLVSLKSHLKNWKDKDRRTKGGKLRKKQGSAWKRKNVPLRKPGREWWAHVLFMLVHNLHILSCMWFFSFLIPYLYFKLLRVWKWVFKRHFWPLL